MSVEDWLKLILGSNVVAAVLVGIFGIVTLKMGIKKYASEKWWERRAEAYAAVISGLHGMLAYHSKYRDALSKGYVLSDDYALALDKERLIGSDAAKKGANIGSFMMSKRADSILKQTVDELESISPFTDDMVDYHEKKEALVSDAITKMTMEAKRDLKT